MIGWRSKPQAIGEEKPKGFDDFDLRLGDIMRGERATMGKSLLDVQRELKIKATFIAAIENADISTFESPGFIAGYVRSYARYLGLDPDETFRRFCQDAQFQPAHGMASGASGRLNAPPAPMAAAGPLARKPRKAAGQDPLAGSTFTFAPPGESLLSRIEVGAIGSVAVLIALIGAIGYGGWSILQEVQRVQLAPVDEAPSVVFAIDPVLQESAEPETLAQAQNAAGTRNGNLMDRLYRPEALDVPVMVSRNGPIAAIDPRRTGMGRDQADQGIETALAEALAEPEVQVVAEAKPGIEVLAVRPAWVRVSATDGTVLFEKILNAGERYSVPKLAEAASFRAGNSGAVYFVVDGKTYGPAAKGANVVKGIALSNSALTERYAEADPGNDPDLAGFLTAQNAVAATQ